MDSDLVPAPAANRDAGAAHLTSRLLAKAFVVSWAFAIGCGIVFRLTTEELAS
jgi:hypothetical protein